MSPTLYSCFSVINDLIINGSTSPLGELTNNTITYAKDPDFYSQAGVPINLVGFRGVSETSNYEKVPDAFVKPVTDMLNWLYNQAKTNKTTNSSQACLQLLKTNYVTGWTWADVGVMVTNNAIWLPSSIRFTLTVGDVTCDFKIWFANEYFAVEFPYREIYVVHPIPITDIDSLADQNYKQVKALIQAQTTSKIEARVDALLGTDYAPPSRRVVYSFDIYDLINTGNKNTGDWTVIYYGNPNDAEEQTYEQIKDCILKNSKHTEEEWAEVIPDLFNPLEFAVVPYWDNIGIQNETVQGSTLSPIFTYDTGLTYPNKYGALWDSSQIIKSLQVVPSLYKSASMAFIGKPTNHNDLRLIKQVFPDYQLIPSADSQAGMMSKATSQFIKDLEGMLAAGETVTPDGMPPTGIQRVMKNGMLYITRRTSNVKISMITRYQFVKDGILTE
jgi:hypothetical protein